MNKEFVEGLFKVAKIPVLKMWKLENKYWPSAYTELILQNPWWLVKTPYGLIEIGPRKRVISIGWEETEYRGIITPDDVTKNDDLVHAWTELKAAEYLMELGKQLAKIHLAKTEG